MKPISMSDVREAGVETFGQAKVVVLPPSNAKAAAKGGWQAAGGVLAGLLTILTALWFEPTVGATIAAAIKEHPEWAIYFAMANVVFGFLKNRLTHKEPETRMAIVGEPTRTPRR